MEPPEKAGCPGLTDSLIQWCPTASESSEKQYECQANPPLPLLVPKLTSSGTSNEMESLKQGHPALLFNRDDPHPVSINHWCGCFQLCQCPGRNVTQEDLDWIWLVCLTSTQ